MAVREAYQRMPARRLDLHTNQIAYQVVVSGNFNGGDGQKSQKRNPNVQTASPLPDPQDTGLSAGRGAARARAERNADTGGGE